MCANPVPSGNRQHTCRSGYDAAVSLNCGTKAVVHVAIQVCQMRRCSAIDDHFVHDDLKHKPQMQATDARWTQPA